MDNPTIECPGEAHRKDMSFNPGSQGPYGDGYHDCIWCEGEYYITQEVYDGWLGMEKRLTAFRERIKEEKDQERTIRKLQQSVKTNIV